MKNKLQILQELFTIIKKSKKLLPQESYTAELFMKGKEKIANKVGEEAVETITAFLLDNKDEIKRTCIFLYEECYFMKLCWHWAWQKTMQEVLP